MRSRQSFSSPHPPGFLHQIEQANKVLSFSKQILVALVAIILWAARLQWNVADLQRQVTDMAGMVASIQQDRREHIKEADAWRTAEEKADLKRDMQLDKLTEIVATQTGKIPSRTH